MDAEIFAEQVAFRVGALPVTRTMITSACVSAVLLAAALGFGRALRRNPDGAAAATAVLLVAWLDELADSIVGRPEPGLGVFAGSLFLFIAACNLSGQLPGVEPPTASLATTSALASLVFVAVPIAGVRTHGLRGYLAEYLRPNPLFAPIHLISEISRTVALSVRLFGNMLSGHLVVGILVALTGLFVPMPMMALDVLIGLLQAYIFAVLALVYVGAAVRVASDDRASG